FTPLFRWSFDQSFAPSAPFSANPCTPIEALPYSLWFLFCASQGRLVLKSLLFFLAAFLFPQSSEPPVAVPVSHTMLPCLSLTSLLGSLIACSRAKLCISARRRTSACRRARMPGNCSVNTRHRNRSASTCLPSRLAFAPTPANPAPTKRPGASPPCSTTSTTSAGPTRSIPPTRATLPRSEEHTSELQSPYDLVC